jgi:hypothetical protein
MYAAASERPAEEAGAERDLEIVITFTGQQECVVDRLDIVNCCGRHGRTASPNGLSILSPRSLSNLGALHGLET